MRDANGNIAFQGLVQCPNCAHRNQPNAIKCLVCARPCQPGEDLSAWKKWASAKLHANSTEMDLDGYQAGDINPDEPYTIDSADLDQYALGDDF